MLTWTNVTGKQAVYTLASGLRIATVGGQFDLDQYVASETDGVSVSLTQIIVGIRELTFSSLLHLHILQLQASLLSCNRSKHRQSLPRKVSLMLALVQ